MHKTYSSRLPAKARLAHFRVAIGLSVLAILVLTPGVSVGSVANWSGNSDSQWNTAGNWDTGVPTSSTAVYINSTTNNPVLLSGPATVASLTTGAGNSLTMNGSAGLLTDALSNAGTMTLGGGANLVLQGAGAFQNTGMMSLSGGTISGSTLTNSGAIATVTGTGSTLGDSVTNNSGGTIAVSQNSGLLVAGGTTITNNGQITMNAGAGSVSNFVLTGSGTVTLGGSGTLAMTNSTANAITANAGNMTLMNGAGHTITGAGSFGGGLSTFQNEGSVTASGSAGLTFSGVTVINTGTLAATGGTLTLGAVTNAGGTIRADAAAVQFQSSLISGGTLDIIDGGNMSFGAAQVLNASLHVGVGSTATLQSANISGGTANIEGTVTLGGGTISGITLTNSGVIATAAGTGSTLGGSVTNNSGGTISVSQSSGLLVTGGTAITNNGQITLNAAAGNVSDFMLTGSGTVTLGGSGTLAMTNSTANAITANSPNMTLVNGAGHTITGAGNFGGGLSTFQNEGTVTASGSAGLTFSGVTVINTGTITATGGTLSLGNMTNAGGILRADGAAVQSQGGLISGGTLDIIDGGNMSFGTAQVLNASLHVGAGSTATLQSANITGGTANVEGTITLGGAIISGITLTNSGTIATVTGTGSTLGGSVTNNSGGTISVSANSGLLVTGGSTLTNNGQITLNAGAGNVSDFALTGSGTVTLGGSGTLTMTNSTGNEITANSANMTLVNGAGHTITGAGVVGGSGGAFTFENKGTLDAGGSAGLTFDSSVSFVNTGTISVLSGVMLSIQNPDQTAGSTVVDGVVGPANSSFTVEGGSVSGKGNILGGLVNTGGQINPGDSTDTLTVGGDFAQGPGGSLDIQVGAAGSDQLAIAGSADLGGTLNVTLSPGFTPVDGAWYTIMTFRNGTSQFDNVNLPTYRCQLIYEADQVEFQYQVPEPATGLILLGGLIGCLRRRR